MGVVCHAKYGHGLWRMKEAVTGNGRLQSFFEHISIPATSTYQVLAAQISMTAMRAIAIFGGHAVPLSPSPANNDSD